jgi:hypothetical protein
MHRCQHGFKKIPSNLCIVPVGSISFQEISYAGKPQVASRYILSNLCTLPIVCGAVSLVQNTFGSKRHYFKSGPGKLTAPLSAFRNVLSASRPNVMQVWYQQAGGVGEQTVR